MDPNAPVQWLADREKARELAENGDCQAAAHLLARQLAEIAALSKERLPQDAALQVENASATAHLDMGRCLQQLGAIDDAFEALSLAVKGFHSLGNRLGCVAAMGAHAEVVRDMGQPHQALFPAEEALKLARGTEAEALACVRLAGILKDLDRHAEAEKRYDEALRLAQETRDFRSAQEALVGKGVLADILGDHAAAVTYYKESLRQNNPDKATKMHTADLLGTAETNLGHFEAARTWYSDAEKLAFELRDSAQLGAIAQNLAVLAQEESQTMSDSSRRAQLLEESLTWAHRAMRIHEQLKDVLGIARAYAQLGVIHVEMGDLNQAEGLFQQALIGYEGLRHPGVRDVYRHLEKLCQSRNDLVGAAAWRRKSV